ncbi:MAG TPA: hypothetical protein VIH93_09935 [Thermoanaerobaculia bacterium]
MSCRNIVIVLAVAAGLASSLGLRAQEAVARGVAAPAQQEVALPSVVPAPSSAAPANGLSCLAARPAEAAFVPATVISWCCNFPTRKCYHTTTGCPTFPPYTSLAACLNRCDP